jgi:GT2 family glycosyltransferase
VFLHIRTKSAQHGGISITQALHHFSLLTRTIGISGATRAVIRTFFQLLFREGGLFVRSKKGRGNEFRLNQLAPHNVPVIRGVPRRWATTIQNLIDLGKYYQLNGFPEDHRSFAVARLREVIEKSANKPESARVTVVIPAFNSFHEIATCLESIFSFSSVMNFKVIIADDASPDVSFSSLGALQGVTTFRNPKNLGYIPNINHATIAIDTEYLITLNQDVIVCPGWLDELVLEADRHPQVGIVGPQILDQDFKILEAGGIVFQDAHAAHRGRGAQSNNSRYNFACDVDYVSGCAMLVRTALWKQLGGLDLQYSPAYYDDVDLCLRARLEGFRTRYTPLACVIHFEGTSMGKDEHDSSSPKHFQLVNRVKISNNHPELNTHTSIDNFPRVDSHVPTGIRVVCIFESMPFRDRDGGAVDFNLCVEYLLELNYSVSALFLRDIAPEHSVPWRSLGIQCAQLQTDEGLEVLKSSHLIFSFGTMVGIFLANEDHLPKKKWLHHSSDCATRRLEAMNDIHKNHAEVSPHASRWFLGLPRTVPEMWELEKKTFERPSATLFVTPHDL